MIVSRASSRCILWRRRRISFMEMTEDRGPFEVWRMDTRNLFGAYPSLDDALRSVRALVKQHGSGATESMMLLFDDGEDFIDLAAGETLAKFALAGRVPDDIVKRIKPPGTAADSDAAPPPPN
jgi:hypothetical protein